MARKPVIWVGVAVIILFILFASGAFEGIGDFDMPGNEQTVGGDSD